MPKLRLSEKDRERLGCAEWLHFEFTGVTNREAITISKVLGLATPSVMRSKLTEADPAAWTAMVWVALRRAGVEVELADLEFDYDEVQAEAEDEPAELVTEPGKESTPTETSTPGTTSTES